MSATPNTPGPTTAAEEAEVAALSLEDRETYYEAVACGASHDDAMEAADTGGYTRPADFDPSEAELARYYDVAGGGEDPVWQQIRDAGRPGR